VTRFAYGDEVVLRNVWDGRAWGALPVRVVRDDDDVIALYVASGTRYRRGRALDGDPEQPKWPWRLVDAEIHTHHFLMIAEPGRAYAVWPMWRERDFELVQWYVNLQEPLRRTPIGFDTRDNHLDIVVAPDLSSWHWKDEDALEDAVAIRILTIDEASAIRAEGEAVAAQLDAGMPPADPRWADWRPEADWEGLSAPDMS
jgi:hypothetical protein